MHDHLPPAVPTPVPDVVGVLETHLTVVCPDTRADQLALWAGGRGLGFVHIVLARGRTRSQYMVNLAGEGSADAQIREAAGVAADLTADGFRVVRLKTETVPWAEGVPHDDATAAAQDPARYFEHHVKLLLPAGQARTPLEALVLPHGAHVSWNARRVRDDGQVERFVTQRCHGVGRTTADQRVSGLLQDLRAAAFPILEVEREFVVSDTNLALDNGWIGQESSS
ncbi:hypothetical protein [Streptomyces sp. H39-S7]|uniref:hypothetical protein n=1 Tax=Streptomyces sp. H39-S7 TaxID=3004357 RepID=UPI0022AEF4CA|nr:hypothetical protein [Streptomyces sp. H39-S7]MCZ4126061.1 hypothetical protein [Streptomyces sp. H39-S7]